MSSNETRFISADGHVMEPADLWITRMDKRFRDRAPHVESRDDADYLCIDGVAPTAATDLIGTMANEKAEGKPIKLIPEAVVVPAGIVRLMERQEEGWSYIRP